MHCIYIITNTINGKVYIGQSKNPRRRWNEHKRPKTNSLVANAIKEFGVENFKMEILLDNLASDEVDDFETFLIAEYDSINLGYNICKEGGSTRGCIGRKFTEEHKRKIAEAHKGFKHSDETKQRISKLKKGRKGTPHTEEHKRKISEMMKGDNHPVFGKKGEQHPMSKLLDAQRTEIFIKYFTTNITQAELGVQYELRSTQIWDIIHRYLKKFLAILNPFLDIV